MKIYIENLKHKRLIEVGFEEIVTPFFSYHQHEVVPSKELLRFSDRENHLVSLRADSTLDVVRIVTRRLGRLTEHKKWFYIQPILKYPSCEHYQIGGELIAQEDLSGSINIISSLLDELTCSSYLQISNIEIPRIVSQMFDIPLEVLKAGQLEPLLNKNEPWLSDLATLQHVEQLDGVIAQVPDELKSPLQKIKLLAMQSVHKRIIIAPLYYAKMRYYDELYFRFVDANKTLGSGGAYQFEGKVSSGFALYTDEIIETLMK